MPGIWNFYSPFRVLRGTMQWINFYIFTLSDSRSHSGAQKLPKREIFRDFEPKNLICYTSLTIRGFAFDILFGKSFHSGLALERWLIASFFSHSFWFCLRRISFYLAHQCRGHFAKNWYKNPLARSVRICLMCKMVLCVLLHSVQCRIETFFILLKNSPWIIVWLSALFSPEEVNYNSLKRVPFSAPSAEMNS